MQKKKTNPDYLFISGKHFADTKWINLGKAYKGQYT